MTTLAYPRPARSSRVAVTARPRLIGAKLALLALLAALAVVMPRSARASEGEVAKDFKRGPYAEFAWRPAIVPLRDDIMPAARTHFMIGARIAPALTLGTMGHMTIYFDKDQKVGAGIDAMIQLNVVRGFFLRAGAGVISHVPIARSVTERTPGYGGQVGLGYAFKLGGKDSNKGVHLGLGADYDLRILPDKRRRGVFVLGLTFMFG